MSNALLEELQELANRSRSGASEREIETDLVHLLGSLGWSRSQIKQDVPVSDRGEDKSDIVLYEAEKARVVVEVKRLGLTRDAERQVQRYAALLKPQIALLTDGNDWSFYYVGHTQITPFFKGKVLTRACAIDSTLNIVRPRNLSILTQNGTFSYLELVDQSLNNLSEQSRSRMSNHFAKTALALLQTENFSFLSKTPLVEKIQQTAPSQTISKPSILGEPLNLTVPVEQIEKEYNPLDPPDLTHTSVMNAMFGQEASRDWNGIVHLAIRAATKAGLSMSDIEELTQARLKQGRYSELGYKLVNDTDISIQGVAAKLAWKYIIGLNSFLDYPLQVRFRWQDKKESQFPGQIGKFVWLSKGK